jgi:hypothetical protein
MGVQHQRRPRLRRLAHAPAERSRALGEDDPRGAVAPDGEAPCSTTWNTGGP